MSILGALVVMAGCDDDKGIQPGAEKGPVEKSAGTEEPDNQDEDEQADEEDQEAAPTYKSLAEEYSELEAAYDDMQDAPAGLADQMREWGLQMMYVHDHDGHMAPGPMHGKRGEGGMHGSAEDPPSPEMGPNMPAHMSGFGEWHRQMSDFHQAEAKERARGGQKGIARRHRTMARHHVAMAESLEDVGDRDRMEVTAENQAEAGESLYVDACATCHATDGTGVTKAFPPLDGAEIVTGDPELLTRITLHGMEGPLRVGEENYNGFMPSFAGRFSNDELAAIITYIRSSWGNEADAVTAETVAEVRKKTKDSPGALSTIEEGLAPTVE